ncbi:MAG: HAD family hydrolase [Chthoniobacter sp.]|nr:HAD family hydrolase [Chthoniobacter sp.]
MIFDLDGTILSTNSFRLWVGHILWAPFPHLGRLQRLGVTCTAMKELVARKTGLIGHETLKWRLQKLWQQAITGDNGAVERDFVERLRSFVRPELVEVLNAVAEGEIEAVMATAAVADYADGFGKSLGFRHILATSRTRDEGEPSNLSIHKCNAVLDFIAERGWQDRVRILFTDHRDDLPLIRRCQTVYWFGSDRERMALDRNLPEISLRPGLQGCEILLTQPA